MSQGYVPGPLRIFVGTGTSAAYEFLGYTQDGVQLQLLAAYEDIMSDFGGPAIPVDSQFMGEHGYISATLNKYNESVLQKLAARRQGVGGSVVAGRIESNGLGSLMVAEAYAVKILLLCPYAAKTFQSSSIVPCYEFSAGWLHDDFTVPLSVRLKAPRIILRVVPVWNAATLSATLYTNVLPDPVPSSD